MTDNPLVSILISSYNYGRFLSEAIESAVNQTYRNIEVIVVDDGSTDDSPRIISSYGKTITPILKANEGHISTLNLGYERSRGEIICFLDADDVFALGKVERIVGLFKANDTIGWCFHDVHYINTSGEPVSDVTHLKGPGTRLIDVRRAILAGKTRFGYTGVATGAMCFTRKLISRILPIPTSISEPCDYFMRNAAFFLSPGIHVSEDLSYQRIHGNNLWTSRKDIYPAQIKTFIKTAFYLRERFPEMTRFTDKLFVGNIGRSIGAGLFPKVLALQEFKEYLSRYMSVMKLGRYGYRILFNSLKELLR